jgi:hypothetical protein
MPCHQPISRRNPKTLQSLAVFTVAAVATLVAACGSPTATARSLTHRAFVTAATPMSAPAFTYGFDFSNQEPDPPTQDTSAKGNNPAAVSAARRVLAEFAGSTMDQSIDGFGAQDDPEPTVGKYVFTSMQSRLRLIASANGIPVITLVQAPEWMHTPGLGVPNNESAFEEPPTPNHFKDFANLCAHIALAFPQVKYFVVWSEMRGFYDDKTHTIDAASYTQMYNDVYTAIKAVRPDAMVGGPYTTMAAFTSPQPGTTISTLHGSWGYLGPAAQNAIQYWLAHKIGADFVTMDGPTEIATSDSARVANPVTASEKFAAVDRWLRAKTNLPIWWMESHIEPTTGWSKDQAAAARVATLILMNASGASVGMQWQPQNQLGWGDEGLWTSTLNVGGGQPTPLADDLLPIMPVLRQRLTLVSGQPAGVLAATDGSHVLLVNTNATSSSATVDHHTVALAPGEVTLEGATTKTPLSAG